MRQQELQFNEVEKLDIYSVIVMGVDFCPITDTLPSAIKSPALVYAGWDIREDMAKTETIGGEE